MIELQGVNKYYGAVQALKDISFKVNKGEIVGFLGPNGAGKTTTMRILNGFMPATSGEALVSGYSVASQPMEVKRRIGYLPENVSLYNDMTVNEYLGFVARAKRIARSEVRAKVDRVAGQCGLSAVSNRLIGSLSKGYKQRTGLAQAIINEPEVLIMDEPTTGLDPAQIIEIRELIKSFAGEHTIILSTHILQEVNAICQRVIIINEGRIVAEDSLENLTGAASGGGNVMVRVQGEAGAVRQKLAEIPGVVSVREAGRSAAEAAVDFIVVADAEVDVRRKVADAVVGAGCGLLELRPIRLSLEEIFIQTITKNT
ncbi:MAG TPA: ATP-binding cassette domain-containing protein [Candidatus Glassbacteria bacterium]|nr:ATP-binding cassette domain-containing protein [Candidatus Glassbacteria bacterium]